MSVFDNIYNEYITQVKKDVEQEYRANCQTIYNSYYTSVVSSFSWKNYPETTLRFLPERHLYYYGLMACCEKDGKIWLLPATPSGTLLPNGEYSAYMVFTLDGKSWRVNREDITLCYNNCRMLPSYIFVSELAEKSGYALSTVDVSLEKAMLPAIVEARTPEQMKMIAEMYNKKANLKPFSETLSSAISKNEISVHKIFDNRETDILALWDVYVRYRNLFYTTFGINNVEIQKKERLTEAEGSGNDEIARFTLLNDMFECRKDFIEQTNSKFGTNLEIELNRNSSTVYELSIPNDEKIENTIIEISKGSNLPMGNENESEESDNGIDN